MFICESINNRYKTLEKNIKAKSNSFYDSYLDLIEETIKYILNNENVEFDNTRTCGYILRTEIIQRYFLENFSIEEVELNKIIDHIKKCNDHKHKKEKNLDCEGMLNYVASYFNLIKKYSIKTGIEYESFDANYFRYIYGADERLNKQLENELRQLEDELKESFSKNRMSEQDAKTYASMLKETEQALMTLEEKNQNLLKEINILKDIKINTMEHKLNKTLDLLNQLTESVVENRVTAYAIGATIVGKEQFESRVNKAKEEMKKRHPSL